MSIEKILKENGENISKSKLERYFKRYDALIEEGYLENEKIISKYL